MRSPGNAIAGAFFGFRWKNFVHLAQDRVDKGRPKGLKNRGWNCYPAGDVAVYTSAREHSQDLRFTGNLTAMRKRFHYSTHDPYGKLKEPDGRLLDDGATLR